MEHKVSIVREGLGRRVGNEAWEVKVGAAESRGRLDIMVGDVAYASGPPLHVHDDQDDMFLVLDGVLTVQAGDHVVELRRGDFIHIPPGVPHTFDNLQSPDAIVTVVNVMTPAGFEALQDDMSEAAADPSSAATIAARHGIRRVGPPLSTDRLP